MKKLIPLFLALGMLVWQGCKRCDDPTNPECENFDPCWDAQPLQAADFKMWQPLRLDYTAPVYDTVFMNKTLVLEADSGYESYEWTIGLDTTKRHTRLEPVEFYAPYGRIDITLVVRWTPDTLCYPEDDGVDTVQKTIYVVDVKELPIWGSYHGYATSAPEDTFTMRLTHEEYTWVTGEVGILEGLPVAGCRTPYIISGATAFYLGTSSGRIEVCDPHGRKVYGVLSPGYDSLVVTYETYPVGPDAPSPTPFTQDTFIGTRIR